ncbi:phosphoglycerol transferase MdoB-like AlkP superfamily enzyme [Geomicrobium halophilum]|uniref:Phosphoglycerol transferase MdoB-like AlkP superfamily enzyme n=1 Tax=Geomicrobium halophilum TaxID=549000 RepID=A0A841PUC7_9BACL|nr:hypothetical protein [Geomicrobium halophilum]MBB6449901.1 phosphoglycerol transferase MdoB-like AlkP superfamily enzyme [Geomicrobium halophilum]
MVLGWAFAAMSLLIIPILFGAAAVIMGYLYKKHDDQHGTIIMIASIGTAIFGVLLGAITYPY